LVFPISGIQLSTPSLEDTTLSPTISPELEGIISESTDEILPVIVQFQDNYDSQMIGESLDKAEIPDMTIRNVFDTIPVASIYATPTAIENILKLTGIIYITYDHRRIIDSQPIDIEPNQIGLDDGYVHSDEILSANPLWDEGYDGSGVTIAIIDSGAEGTHPDLEDRIIAFYDLIGGNHDLDPQGGIDAYDDNGHGTAVAWLAAGTGDGTNGNYTGLAPGADLFIIKALDDAGAADDSVIAQGIEYATISGVDIISLSVGGDWLDDPNYPEPSVQAVRSAIQAGIIVVIAGGNSGPATQSITSPGVVDEAISVGASIGSIDIVSFSSRGPVVRERTDPSGIFAKPDILAPGYFVLSGRLSTSSTLEYPPYNTTQFTAPYTLWSGTSAACPQIAGLAALLLDKHPGITPVEAKAYLMAGATDLGVDPMEQGYGLANVTKSSELYTNTSGVITVMSPLRFPTLPGSDQVFIIGDSRPPQNITIISTGNRGSVNLELSGNASDFIIAPEHVVVTVGHNYFGIALDIPEDMPLSALGRYTGSLDMIDGSEVIASVELSLLITEYGGRVLVDMAHHSDLDPDDPDYFRYFGDYLREQGMIVTPYPTNWLDPLSIRPIDSATVASAEVLMIMDTEDVYSTEEIDTIHTYVNQGGILLILSEGFDTQNNIPAFAYESYNLILAPYGIQCEENWIGNDDGDVYGADNGGVVEVDSLTEGVENIFILNGGTLSVDSSVAGAEGLIWTDAARTHALLATVDVGEGKVIALSDGSMLFDTTIYDAVRLNADNLRLLKNVAEAIFPVEPRIYDVRLEYGNIGEPANFTAYIFDENLDDVDITLRNSVGSSIQTTVVESLGYKYFLDFELGNAGFYELTIVATDTDGNTRDYVKTFLVPVPVVQDEFLLGVMYSLLAIVGVALLYVGILKFGKRKPKPPKFEREWSPEWEDDSTPTAPPSIE
jgi:serine protease AprX